MKLKLNGELDLKYFDINLTEDNEIYSDSDSKNENETRKTNDDNKTEKKQNNKIQPFDEFSFYASDEKTNRNSSSDEEDFF